MEERKMHEKRNAAEIAFANKRPIECSLLKTHQIIKRL
jgi:hypothetical protein